MNVLPFSRSVLHEPNGTFGLRKMFDALMMIRSQEILGLEAGRQRLFDPDIPTLLSSSFSISTREE